MREAEQILYELDLLQKQLIVATDLRDSLVQAGLLPYGYPSFHMINIGLRIRGLQEELERRQGNADLPQHVCSSLQKLGFLAHRLPQQEELKEAYHKLAKIAHPDAGGDVQEMKKLNSAYEVISKWIGVAR